MGADDVAEHIGRDGAVDEIGEFVAGENCGLERDVELLDALQPGDAGLADAAQDAGLSAMGDFLMGEGEQELMEGPVLGRAAFDELVLGTAGMSQVQTLEQGGQLVGPAFGAEGDGAGGHRRPSGK